MKALASFCAVGVTCLGLLTGCEQPKTTPFTSAEQVAAVRRVDGSGQIVPSHRRTSLGSCYCALHGGCGSQVAQGSRFIRCCGTDVSKYDGRAVLAAARVKV